MDNEIIKTKKEIKFYIKESLKYFGIITLTYIKQIALLILSIIKTLQNVKKWETKEKVNIEGIWWD